MPPNKSTFESEFLGHYLSLGLGSMPKSDIDALVLYLIDRYGLGGSPPLSHESNQTVSERLRTPVAKIKRLRYEAALKFGSNTAMGIRVEDQAKARLLAALSRATLEPKDDSVLLLIEDALAKNWLQGQLKIHQQIFDHSFNTEIVRVSASGLFLVLGAVFGEAELKAFSEGYKKLKGVTDDKKRVEQFKSLAGKFVEGAAKAAGAGVVTVLKSLVGTP